MLPRGPNMAPTSHLGGVASQAGRKEGGLLFKRLPFSLFSLKNYPAFGGPDQMSLTRSSKECGPPSSKPGRIWFAPLRLRAHTVLHNETTCASKWVRPLGRCRKHTAMTITESFSDEWKSSSDLEPSSWKPIPMGGAWRITDEDMFPWVETNFLSSIRSLLRRFRQLPQTYPGHWDLGQSTRCIFGFWKCSKFSYGYPGLPR